MEHVKFVSFISHPLNTCLTYVSCFVVRHYKFERTLRCVPDVVKTVLLVRVHYATYYGELLKISV
jgi:hypothetical protein